MGHYSVARVTRAWYIACRSKDLGSEPIARTILGTPLVLFREHGRAVHAHAARAADHHPAALAVRERPVVPVLDDVEAVEERRLLRRADLVLLEGALARRRVVAPDLQGNLQLSLPDR